jgi:predicted transcriptional regulator
MYSKSVMENKTRKMIYNYISAEPGVSFSTIRGVLDIAESTLRYHLQYLERENRIYSKLEGNHRNYYTNDRQRIRYVHFIEEKDESEELTKLQHRLLTLIRQNPGITINELMKITRQNKKVIQNNIKKLREHLMIWKVGFGRNTGYEYLTKKRLQSELFKLLILKFLRNEIDEETYLYLREELENNGF